MTEPSSGRRSLELAGLAAMMVVALALIAFGLAFPVLLPASALALLAGGLSIRRTATPWAPAAGLTLAVFGGVLLLLAIAWLTLGLAVESGGS